MNNVTIRGLFGLGINLIQRLGFSVLSLSRYSKNLFAFGWAPCAVSLTMPVALLIMSQEISIWQGGGLSFIFGLGHAVPIIPLATLSGEMRARVRNRFATTQA